MTLEFHICSSLETVKFGEYYDIRAFKITQTFYCTEQD